CLAVFSPALNSPLTISVCYWLTKFRNSAAFGSDAMPTAALPTAAQPDQVNLVVATPCYGGQGSVLYAPSLFNLQQLIRSYSGLAWKVLFKDGDALITRARASLLSQFLDDPAA